MISLAPANVTSGSACLEAQILEPISPPSVEAFQRCYVAPRRPVVLRGMIRDWPAMHRWSLDYLRTAFATTPVVTLRAESGRVIMNSDTGGVEERMQLRDFIGALHAGANDRYLTSPMSALPESLRRDAPLPLYCARASWHNSNLWIGPAGTIACLHRDLADNLHGVVSGRKRFTLVAPRQSSLVYPNGLFHSFPNGCRVDVEHPDFRRFPRLRGVETLVAELEPGDAIYIPRRWWHHARTLAVSVSVNFWWASGLQRAIVLLADTIKRVRGISR